MACGSAQRGTYGSHELKAWAITVLAPDDMEASRIALGMTREHFPEDDGWKDHNITIDPVDPGLMAAAVADALGAAHGGG